MSKILVGIGGGIAAYKVATAVSRLVQNNHDVQVVLTHGGEHFVGRSTFAALCNEPPVCDVYDARFPLGAHIELAENAKLLLVAPATARLLSSFAHAAADDLLATLYLSCECPVLLAPAMSSPMWEKPAVQRNVNQLRSDGVHLVGPESGWLSCRKQGAGRMSEPEALLEEVYKLIDA
ncbi:MAG: flavoprotein [Planctomycetota bacterium]